MKKTTRTKISNALLAKSASNLSFENCEFVDVRERRGGHAFRNINLIDCSLRGYENQITPPKSAMPVWENIRAVRCFAHLLKIGEVVIKNSQFVDISVPRPSPWFYGVVFSKVVFSGTFKSHLSFQIPDRHDAKLLALAIKRWERAWEKVEWAIDIRKATFVGDVWFHGIPGELIKRNQANSILLDNFACRQIDRKSIGVKSRTAQSALAETQFFQGWDSEDPNYRIHWQWQLVLNQETGKEFQLVEKDFQKLCRLGLAKR